MALSTSNLFVGGTGRSGTTILLEYLGQNSSIEISHPPEIQILTDKEGLLDLYENKNINNFEKYINKIRKEKENGFYSFVNLIEEKEMQFMMNILKNNFNTDPKKAIVEFYNNLFKKRNDYLADSSTESIQKSHKINQIFLNSKFIHVFRDGRDAGYSEYEMMKDYKFYNKIKTPFDGLNFWHKRIINCFNSLELINSNQYINVRLEDLVINNREFEKNKIINFLSIKNEEKMESFFNKKITKEKMSIGKWKTTKFSKDFDKKYDEILKELKDKNIFIEKYY
jgi:hypothetical protein